MMTASISSVIAAEKSVNQDAEQRQQRGDDGRTLDLLADDGADILFFNGLQCRLWKFIRKELLHVFGRADGRGYAQGFRAVGNIFLILDLRILFPARRESRADLFHIQFLREAEFRAVAAQKVHAEEFFTARKNAEGQ